MKSLVGLIGTGAGIASLVLIELLLHPQVGETSLILFSVVGVSTIVCVFVYWQGMAENIFREERK